MADAIDTAAAAFDADMGRTRSAPAGRQSESSVEQAEDIFPNLGEKIPGTEGDIAGGDDLPDPKPKKAKAPVEEDVDPDDEDVDPDADPDDEDVDPDADPDDEDVDPDADPDDDEDPSLDEEYTVMVDGQEKQVKLREALDGYIRTETFHTRLNHLNEVQKVITAEGNQVIADRKKYVDMLSEAEELLKELVPEEPDWEAEYAKDPTAAAKMQKAYKGIIDKLTDVRSKREAAQKEAVENDRKATEKFAQTEFPKFAQIAGWRNKGDMEKDLKSMRRTAQSVGFTNEEIGTVYDSRMLEILRRASKYDRIIAARPKPVRKVGGKQVNPGAGTTRGTAHKGLTAAQAKLSKSGSIDAAADVFAQMLKPQRRR